VDGTEEEMEIAEIEHLGRESDLLELLLDLYPRESNIDYINQLLGEFSENGRAVIYTGSLYECMRTSLLFSREDFPTRMISTDDLNVYPGFNGQHELVLKTSALIDGTHDAKMAEVMNGLYGSRYSEALTVKILNEHKLCGRVVHYCGLWWKCRKAARQLAKAGLDVEIREI
jgi:hypothetical protein